MVCMLVIGIYLIIQTESHLEEAATQCDNALTDGRAEDDFMLPWYYNSCFKGKVYPFVPIEDYTSSEGEKLYCDCKYAIIRQ